MNSGRVGDGGVSDRIICWLRNLPRFDSPGYDGVIIFADNGFSWFKFYVLTHFLYRFGFYAVCEWFLNCFLFDLSKIVFLGLIWLD